MKDYIATLNKSLLQLLIDAQNGKLRMCWGYINSADHDGNYIPHVFAITSYYGIIIPQHECYINLGARDYKENGMNKYLPEETGIYFADQAKRVNTDIVSNVVMNDGKKHATLIVNDDIAIDTKLLKPFGSMSHLSIYASTSPYMWEVYYDGNFVGIVTGMKRRKAAQDK